MTKQEAIQLIDNVLAQVSLPREGHVKLQQAMEVIKSLEQKVEEPKQE